MKILITGANGFIGGHLAQHFVDKGDELDGTYRRLLKNAVPGCGYIRIDLSEEVLPPKHYDCVIHCAGQVENGSKWDYVKNSVIATERILDFCEKQDVEKFVFMSSIAVYGECAGIVNEDTKVVNPEIYGMAKRICEGLVEESSVRNRYIIRLSRILGDGGFESGGFLSNFAGKMARGEMVTYTNAKVLYNNMFYITDLMKFCGQLVSHDGKGCLLVGVGASHPLPLREIVDLMRQQMKSTSELKDGGSHPMSCHQIDISRMESLGFQPLEVSETIKRFSEDAIRRYRGNE